jgi:hypothetical protein
MKLTLLFAILTVTVQAVEGAVSVEDTSSVLLKDTSAENAWDKAHKEGPGLESTLVAASFYFDHLEQHRTPRIVAKPKLRF